MRTSKINAIQQLGRWGLAMSLTAMITTGHASAAPVEYEDFYTAEKGAGPAGIDFVQAIAVTKPDYCSEIKGDVNVTFKAPGMTKVEALCWQQPTTSNSSPWGHDVKVASAIKLDADGNGSFVFHADQFPNGPITIRIHAKDNGKKQDICELQLFNKGGVVWKHGIPKTDPPAAKGLKLIFSDDFKGPLSISGDGNGTTYMAHKPGGGDFSGWPFSDPTGDNNPFSQVGGYLRIHASKKPGAANGSTGILVPFHQDCTGVLASPPCYFECRFIAQSAPGTWPAFWTLSRVLPGQARGCDELDIIEAYGGWGPRNPNFPGYAATTHFWDQPKPAWVDEKGPDGKPLHPIHADAPIMEIGGKSSWSTTFHTYGLLITETETTYYFDDIEILRHPTGPIAKNNPSFFLINYAIGGISGWHIDLDRYNNQSDMWVDYVRVYQGGKK